jgi:hypothetical protein
MVILMKITIPIQNERNPLIVGIWVVPQVLLEHLHQVDENLVKFNFQIILF